MLGNKAFRVEKRICMISFRCMLILEEKSYGIHIIDLNLSMPVPYLKTNGINKQKGKLDDHRVQHVDVATLSDSKSMQAKCPA